MCKTIEHIRDLIKDKEFSSIGIREINKQYEVSTPNRDLPNTLKDFINTHFNVQHEGRSVMIFRVKPILIKNK